MLYIINAMFDIIVAADDNWGISRGGKLPWRGSQAARDDMEWFKEMTIGRIVIMGRKTWESLPEKHRPLLGRTNIVLSRAYTEITIMGALTDSPVVYMNDFDCAIDYAVRTATRLRPMVIGGADIYISALC